MKFAIVIPSRSASKRFPGKALYPILGIPLVIRVIRQCAKVLDPSDIYVVTEDVMVASCVLQYGYQVLIDETPASSGTEKVVQVMDQINADRIINVQGDEPVIDPVAIERMIEASLEYPDSVLQAYSPNYTGGTFYDSNSVKIVTGCDDRILYISRSLIPFGAIEFKEHVGIFSYGKHHLEAYGVCPRLPLEAVEDIELVRFLELGVEVRAVCVPGSCPVDSKNDILAVEAVICRLGL